MRINFNETPEIYVRGSRYEKLPPGFKPNTYKIQTDLGNNLDKLWAKAVEAERVIDVPDEVYKMRSKLFFLQDYMKGMGVNYCTLRDQSIWLPVNGLNDHLLILPFSHPKLRKFRRIFYELVKKELNIDEPALLNDCVIFNPFTQNFSPYEKSEIPKLPEQEAMEEVDRASVKRNLEYCLSRTDIAELLDHKFLKDSFVAIKDYQENGAFVVNEKEHIGHLPYVHPRNVVYFHEAFDYKKKLYEENLREKAILRHLEFNHELTADKILRMSEEEILKHVREGDVQILTTSFRRNDLTGMTMVDGQPGQKSKDNYYSRKGKYRSGKINLRAISKEVSTSLANEYDEFKDYNGSAIKARSINSAHPKCNAVLQPLIRADMRVAEKGHNHFPNTEKDYLEHVSKVFADMRSDGYELLYSYHADQTQAETKIASNISMATGCFPAGIYDAMTKMLVQVEGRMYEYASDTFKSGKENTSHGNNKAGRKKSATFYYYVLLFYHDGREVKTVTEIYKQIDDYHNHLSAAALGNFSRFTVPSYKYIQLCPGIRVWKGDDTDDMPGNFWKDSSINGDKLLAAIKRAEKEMERWEINFDEPEAFGVRITESGLEPINAKVIAKALFTERDIGPGEFATALIARDLIFPGILRIFCTAVKIAFSLPDSVSAIEEKYKRMVKERVEVHLASKIPMDTGEDDFSIMQPAINYILDQYGYHKDENPYGALSASGKIKDQDLMRESIETFASFYKNIPNMRVRA